MARLGAATHLKIQLGCFGGPRPGLLAMTNKRRQAFKLTLMGRRACPERNGCGLDFYVLCAVRAHDFGVRTKTVLVTGFEPFGGETINPSQEIARMLHGKVIAGRTVVGAVLPCVFGDSRRELNWLLRRVRPELVIAVGQAGGRAEITPERVAINVDDARIPDNAGAEPIDRPIVRGGPAAYWSTLPVKAIVAALRKKGIPASVSQTAGTFVCNHVFYGLMHALSGDAARKGTLGRRVRGGLIHVPFLPEQTQPPLPSLSLEMMVDAIETAVAVALRGAEKTKIRGGALH
jgi:pyroglutamyl-peptidase